MSLRVRTYNLAVEFYSPNGYLGHALRKAETPLWRHLGAGCCRALQPGLTGHREGAPRKQSSIWSAVNLAKVQGLRAVGRMTPSGEAAFALRLAARSAVYAHGQVSPAKLSTAEVRLFKREPQGCPDWSRRAPLASASLGWSTLNDRSCHNAAKITFHANFDSQIGL